MNRLRQSIIFFIAALFMSGAFADSDKRSLAIEYLELSKTKESFDFAIEAYVNQFATQNQDSDKNKIRDFFNSYMGWDVLKEPTIEIVLDTFSEAELKGINEFYKSKYGKVLAEKTPILSASMSQVIGTKLTKTMSAMQRN